MRTWLDDYGLPFVPAGVSASRPLAARVAALCDELRGAGDSDAVEDAAISVCVELRRLADDHKPPPVADASAARRAKVFMDEHLDVNVSLTMLEAVVGHRRWQLSRDFRAMFGTSPYRYHLQRRIERARAMTMGGATPVAAAHACGFADQSHFCRHFINSVGLTPGAWLAALQR